MKQTRAPKQLGDFGEGLATYALIRKGYEIAFVDHVGADLIAEKNGNRLAISVKTRMFKTCSKESQVFVVEKDHLAKLEHFAGQFGMLPVFALLINLVDERMLHLLIMPVADLKMSFPEVKNGYSIRFTPTKRSELMTRSFVDYSCWKEERIGDKDFF
jgi:Holliday junction resolvase